MQISVITLFPEMFSGPLTQSILKRAQQKNLVTINFVQLRDFAIDTYGTVDDHPYGGGHGMILRVDVVAGAIAQTKKLHGPGLVVLLDPRGKPYKQAKAKELSSQQHLIFVCGHYEGIDERIRAYVDEEIAIGDFVTTGGEIPTMIVIDSIVRLIPGVLSKTAATIEESFTQNLLEHPQYTRPPEHAGVTVPPTLLSGNHAAIDTWKKAQSLEITRAHRPDLLKNP